MLQKIKICDMKYNEVIFDTKKELSMHHKKKILYNPKLQNTVTHDIPRYINVINF